MNGLKGKNVLITGASSGIGQATAIAFAKEGANVVINYARSKEGALETKNQADSYGGQNLIIQADIGNEQQITDMFNSAINALGSLDILINNAAIQIEEPSETHSIESFDRVMGVNLRGAFLCAQKMIKHLLERDAAGVIINVSSPHEIIPKPGFIGYAVSKGGLLNLTRTLALEYADRKIRVCGVAPGATLTRINKVWVEDPQKRQDVEKHIPMKRAAEPDEIAPSILFLASDDASYITGASLFVDGGAALFPSYKENWSS